MNRLYGDKFKDAKVRNEEQNICEDVRQFTVDARKSQEKGGVGVFKAWTSY